MRVLKYLLFFSAVLSLQACVHWGEDDDVAYIYESQYEPITQTRGAFEEEIELQTLRPISQAGKVYVKEQYILINESEEGFHIYNNSNPETPEAIAYLKVPGATDLAIRGNTIFVHHFVDLVAIDFNIYTQSIQGISRSSNVFPRLNSPDGFRADYFDVPADHVIIGYQLKN
ncbi:hypothetical protein ACFQ3R_08560 [Mesonia ostreae]|uniref:Uncharacterized protein n=1 Tax=Mesonia ostreae TaxID=861110 RepID=A0ABU2KEZ2_9FLAO|nr:hypothetical protein [Mesonia ostreae]MDT0293278.1 hypothetical protein [Mesonia ostreae]